MLLNFKIRIVVLEENEEDTTNIMLAQLKATLFDGLADQRHIRELFGLKGHLFSVIFGLLITTSTS